MFTAETTKRADVVPVDMAVNSIICAAWETGQKSKELLRFEAFFKKIGIPTYLSTYVGTYRYLDPLNTKVLGSSKSR